ncbi:hypothetical protein B0H13DRAFT_2350506 [Mycena leptocephala]|nr:hypothetical protein B0H13DRAFT_2350506 [Mycena leptocephala]
MSGAHTGIPSLERISFSIPAASPCDILSLVEPCFHPIRIHAERRNPALVLSLASAHTSIVALLLSHILRRRLLLHTQPSDTTSDGQRRVHG